MGTPLAVVPAAATTCLAQPNCARRPVGPVMALADAWLSRHNVATLSPSVRSTFPPPLPRSRSRIVTAIAVTASPAGVCADDVAAALRRRFGHLAVQCLAVTERALRLCCCALANTGMCRVLDAMRAVAAAPRKRSIGACADLPSTRSQMRSGRLWRDDVVWRLEGAHAQQCVALHVQAASCASYCNTVGSIRSHKYLDIYSAEATGTHRKATSHEVGWG